MLNMQNKAVGAVGPAVGRRAEAAAEARATIGPENENIDDSESTQFSSESKKNKTTGNGLDRFFFSLSDRDVNHFHFYQLPGSFKSTVAPKIDCNTRATHLGLLLQLSRTNVRQERAFMNELES